MVCSRCGLSFHRRCQKICTLYYTDYNKKIIKVKNSKRKNSDYQSTELITALIVCGEIDTNNITPEYMIELSNTRFERGILKCSPEILKKYQGDLLCKFNDNNIKSYIDNFNTDIKLDTVECVYLTGKTFKDYEALVHLNKDYKHRKPNSDVYIQLINGEFVGISCKQSKNCPCTNKVVELNNNELMLLREKLLNENEITKENYIGKRGRNGEISKLFRNNHCKSGNLEKYWSELIKHIIANKDYFIQGVLDSMNQGHYLPYRVLEYDGKELIDTKERFLEKSECDIRDSEIFCWCKTGPRKAAKIWFDFISKDEIIYHLEVRFKGKYFGKEGQPQLFIYKETKEDIESYIKASETYKLSIQ